MASGTYPACLGVVLKEEGGFSNHPRDPGGATRFGITRATLAHWRGRPATVGDVRLLTKAEAAAIYEARYWRPVHGDELPPGVDLALFDLAVNSGPGRALNILQAALGQKQDGVVGRKTLAALAAAEAAGLVRELSRRRLVFLMGLPTWPVFGRGWSGRVRRVEAGALAMVAASAGVQIAFSAPAPG